MVFFGIFEIPNIGSDWLNFICPASFMVAIPMLFLVRESYNRSRIDDHNAYSDMHGADERNRIRGKLAFHRD